MSRIFFHHKITNNCFMNRGLFGILDEPISRIEKDK
jgi:hypothetical protein